MKFTSRLHSKFWFVALALFVVVLGIGEVLAAQTQTPTHHAVFQVNADDPVPMKHAISNSINLVRYYRELN